MPKPAPLTPEQARNTIAHRLSPIGDRLRQLNTRFGLRSQRVFLVWTKWSGEERGEGTEQLLAEVELLPTPRVSDLTSQSRRPYSAGVFPEGSLRVDEISLSAFTFDNLTGLVIPANSYAVNKHGEEKSSNPRVDFWWELQEDGRGDNPAIRRRFRVFGTPNRREGYLYWSVNLERADEPRNRKGTDTQIGVNEGDFPIIGGV